MKKYQTRITQALALILASTTLSQSAFAVTENYNVVTRKKSGAFEITSQPIDGLIARDRFETDHFRVVWKKESEAITLDRIQGILEEQKKAIEDHKTEAEKKIQADVKAGLGTEKELRAEAEKKDSFDQITVRNAEDIELMAANALYHAELARKFFTEQLDSPEVKKLEQVVIRLDHTNMFSEYERFANDEATPQYNNALSIPAGTPFRPKPGLAPWQREIWFRPRKEIPISEILNKLPEDPANSTIRQARAALYPMQIDQTVREATYAVFQNRLTSNSFISSVTRQGGTLLMIEAAFQVLKVVNRFFIPSKFYLDTAYVPEIIHHEFSHIALSDFIKPNVSTPVNEGMADFFAATMGNDPHLARKIKEYSTSISKNGKKRQAFQIEMESLGKAQSDFVLSLLWGLREVLGEKYATKTVFEARKYLDTKESDIRDGLVKALLLSCDTNCESPLRDRMKIYQFLQDRGV